MKPAFGAGLSGASPFPPRTQGCVTPWPMAVAAPSGASPPASGPACVSGDGRRPAFHRALHVPPAADAAPTLLTRTAAPVFTRPAPSPSRPRGSVNVSQRPGWSTGRARVAFRGSGGSASTGVSSSRVATDNLPPRTAVCHRPRAWGPSRNPRGEERSNWTEPSQAGLSVRDPITGDIPSPSPRPPHTGCKTPPFTSPPANSKSPFKTSGLLVVPRNVVSRSPHHHGTITQAGTRPPGPPAASCGHMSTLRPMGREQT